MADEQKVVSKKRRVTGQDTKGMKEEVLCAQMTETANTFAKMKEEGICAEMTELEKTFAKVEKGEEMTNEDLGKIMQVFGKIIIELAKRRDGEDVGKIMEKLGAVINTLSNGACFSTGETIGAQAAEGVEIALCLQALELFANIKDAFGPGGGCSTGQDAKEIDEGAKKKAYTKQEFKEKFEELAKASQDLFVPDLEELVEDGVVTWRSLSKMALCLGLASRTPARPR